MAFCQGFMRHDLDGFVMPFCHKGHEHVGW